MLGVRQLGARFHAIYDHWELVVGIFPLVIIQGEAQLASGPWCSNGRHNINMSCSPPGIGVSSDSLLSRLNRCNESDTLGST